jgi:hypothetical protein
MQCQQYKWPEVVTFSKVGMAGADILRLSYNNGVFQKRGRSIMIV